MKSRELFIVSALVIAMFKNGIHIVILGLLAVHVNIKILDGDLHQKAATPSSSWPLSC